MSKRPRRYMIIEEDHGSGTSVSVPFCANNKDKHEEIENSTTSHKRIPQSQNKRQKCAQNGSSADIIMAETATNENQFDDSNQIGKGQAFYQRSRQSVIILLLCTCFHTCFAPVFIAAKQ